MALTPAQRRARAARLARQKAINQMVNAALLPGRQEVGRARTEARKTSAEEQQRMVELSKALAEIQKEVGPATGAAYQEAARTQGALAQGFSGGLRDQAAKEAADAAAILARQGAPAEQAAQIAEIGKSTPDVLFALGGSIPGGALAREGAAFAAAQNQLPATTLGRGQQQVGQIAKSLREREEQLDAELRDLLGQAPGLRFEAEQKLQQSELAQAESARQDRAQALYEQEFGLKTIETAADIASQKRRDTTSARNARIAEKNYKLAVRRHEQAVKNAAAEGREADAALSKGRGHLVDQFGQPILDKNGKKIPFKTGSSGSGSSALTPKERREMRADGINYARELRGEPVPAPDLSEGQYLAQKGKSEFGDGSTNKPRNAQRDAEYNFREAQNLLVQTYQVTRAQARAWLIAAGWKPGPTKKKYTPRQQRPG